MNTQSFSDFMFSKELEPGEIEDILSITSIKLISEKEDKLTIFPIENVIKETNKSVIYYIKQSDKSIALKQFHDYTSDSSSDILNQINILRFVNHNYIINIIDIGLSNDNFLFITMPCYTGNLEQNIDYINNIPLKKKLSLFLQLLSAYKYLHANNILHLNLSFNKVLLCEISNFVTQQKDFIFKLTGFDNAVFYYDEQIYKKIDYYLAPPEFIFEKILLKKPLVTHKIDVWQLGLFFYKLVTSNNITYNINNEELISSSLNIEEFKQKTKSINKYFITNYFCIFNQLNHSSLLTMYQSSKLQQLLQDEDYIQNYLIPYSVPYQVHTIEPIFRYILNSNVNLRPEVKTIYFTMKNILQQFEQNESYKEIIHLNSLYEIYDFKKNKEQITFISDKTGFPYNKRSYNENYTIDIRQNIITFLENTYSKFNFSMETLICTIDLFDRIASKICISQDPYLYVCIAGNLIFKFHYESDSIQVDTSFWIKILKNRISVSHFDDKQFEVLFALKFDIYRPPPYLTNVKYSVPEWYDIIKNKMLY